MTTNGVFIAFEGGDGAGKTTQIKALVEAVEKVGRTALTTSEPGGSALGSRLRAILLDPATGALDPRTEALLFAADRAEHVATIIRPALAAGTVVVTDRYMDSSAAYQGAGRGLRRNEIIDLSLWAAHGLLPDLTVLLDIDPKVGLVRAAKTEFGAADRIEAEGTAFADAVRAGFLDLAAQHPERYLVVDATEPAAQIAQRVWAAVSRVLRPAAVTR